LATNAKIQERNNHVTWVVNAEQRTVRIHRLDRFIAELQETDTLTGESVLPGFSIAVNQLFPDSVV